MNTLTILRGLPGSGKSTWATNHADKAAIVNLDALRRMASGSLKAWHARASREDTQTIVDAAHLMIDRFLAEGRNVIMDAQNLDPRGCDQLARIAARHGANVEYQTFRLPLGTLLERNRTRPEPDRVPEAYLRHQYAKWDATLLFEVIDHENDRHIISEPTSRAIFLHAVRNTRDFTLDPEADRMVRDLTGEPPLTVAVAHTPGQLETIIDQQAALPGVEGVDLYGADGYMAKVKTHYYLTVKSLRKPLEDTLLHGAPVRVGGERGRLVRAVLDGMPHNRLMYTKTVDGTPAVDMEEVGLWLTEQKPALV